jgi:hypothetical protein
MDAGEIYSSRKNGSQGCSYEARCARGGALRHADVFRYSSVGIAGPGKVRAGRGDEPTSAGGEREGAGEGAPRHADQRIPPGFLFHQQRQYKAASALYERAGSGYQPVLGLEHPTTIACSRHYSSPVQEMQEG